MDTYDDSDEDEFIADPQFDENGKALSNILKNLEKKGLEVKECTCQGERVQFYKGKDLEKYLKENMKEICEDLNKELNVSINPEKKSAIQQVYSIFYKSGIMHKGIREEGDKKKKIRKLLPYEVLCEVYGCNCAKDHNKEELDHKPKLDENEMIKFDPSYYYIFTIERSKRTIYVYLALVIIAIFLYVLMPIWPYKMKVAVWWISYVLLLVSLGLLIVRLIIYLFFFIFGFDVWLFPDLNDEKKGFFESFYRIFSFEKRNEKWYTILIRVIIATVTAYVSYAVYKNPNLINEAKKIIYEALRDCYIFGEDKFVNSWNTTAISVKNKPRSIQEIDDLI